MHSKTELMQRVADGQASEVFTHEHCGAFDVTAMREWAAKNLEPVRMAMDSSFVKFVWANRDVDEQRLQTLRGRPIRTDPAMAVVYEENGTTEHLLIDGTHRIIRRWQQGFTDFPCWVVPLDKVIRPNFEGPYSPEWGSFQMDKDGNIYNDTRDQNRDKSKDN